MRLAFWIPKVTNTHSEYVSNCFPLQQWLHKRASLVLYRFTLCLIKYVSRCFIQDDSQVFIRGENCPPLHKTFSMWTPLHWQKIWTRFSQSWRTHPVLWVHIHLWCVLLGVHILYFHLVHRGLQIPSQLKIKWGEVWRLGGATPGDYSDQSSDLVTADLNNGASRNHTLCMEIYELPRM